MEMNKDQKQVVVAFGDAMKAERAQYLEEGLRALDTHNTIRGLVSRALRSVNHLEGEEAEELERYLNEQMTEYVRRGLQRAIKGMAKHCEGLE